MRKAISDWWNKERVGRLEEGTSQDMCPTNGGVVIHTLAMLVAWTPLLAYILYRL